MSELMTLREICKKGGVSRRMLQEYERNKLVSSVARNKYGHLLYDKLCLDKVKTIRLYQRMGFNLKDICDLMSMDNVKLKICLIAQLKILNAKRDEILELIDITKMMIFELED